MNKKEFNNIKLPNNIDEVIQNALNKAEEDKKNIKYKKDYKKTLKTAVIGLSLCLTLGFGTKVLASNIPIINNIFQLIQQKISFKGDYSKYATSINETVYNNELGVTLSEVLCDGQSLYVTYLVKSNKPFKYININYENKTYKKTQLLDESLSKVSFSTQNLFSSAPLEGNFLDDYNFIGFQKYDLNELKNIPNHFEFNINFKTFRSKSMDNKHIDQIFNGEWNFKIPITVNESLTREIMINDKKDLGIEKVSITPFEIKLKTLSTRDKINYNIRVFDENGKNLNIDSRIYNDNGSTVIIKKNNQNPKKLKVELFKDILNQNNTKIGETIIYSNNINIT